MTCNDGNDRARNTELEAFAAQVAHDFNNLLTGVVGNLELLQLRVARTGAAGLDGYINGANASSIRAVEFAQRLLTYSGRMAQEPETVPLARLLGEIAAMPEWQGLELSLPGEALLVQVDPAQLRLAVVELLRNAREAVQESGSSTMLSAEMEDGDVAIIVRDDGPGMPPEIHAQAHGLLFSTRANGAGRGLGLAIAARVAAAAGGRLELKSAPGAGCVAKLVVPMV
ncbi:MAG: HAMP domain-containing histidine kinase [Rhodospirillales bacterium]|nr:HAMP domain-containing histidine kinase [Rhodospirillales bacterium]MDE2319592.1 HAMP domain-containing histidine kinase [Rhodospirillales bacterium]